MGWILFSKLAYEKGLNLGIIDKYEITHTRPLNIVLSNGNETKNLVFTKSLRLVLLKIVSYF